jgi:hypothetical protein
VAPVKTGGGQKTVVPGAFAGIKPGRSGRIRHLGNRLTGQPEPQVILGQQHLGDAGEGFRLVGSHPFEFRRGEAGKDDIAGQTPEYRIGIKLRRFLVAARIVPQDAGPDHLAVVVDGRRTMHVSRQPDAAHLCQFSGMGLAELRQCCPGCFDPAVGILFRPSVMRPLDGQWSTGRAQDALIFVNQQRLQR